MFRRSLICCLTFTAMLICSSTFANATLTDEAAGTGVISGRVTKQDSTTAIAGASIKVFQGATLSATATADSAGDYTISGLDPGSYWVEASSTGYETRTQAGVLVSNGAATTVNFTLAVPINYVYDELGRLVSAIDQNGNAATYSYDAVGNLLSISRQDQTQAAIIRFSPASGSAGATVTIYGTGFSAQASQNTVTFNGTAASVAQSSMTHIVATVPVGATTGLIAVTSPVGSATSSASFVVGAAPGAPTITGFTPAIGTAGTAVTINGANFDTVPSNDKIAFNTSQGQVNSATATSIAATVPSSTGSGRITVTTPTGKAVSSADFFIPPSPFIASDVEFTSRMALGETKAVAITVPYKIAMVVFDGAAGQRISLSGSNNTLSSAAIYIYKPVGGVLTSIGGFISSTPFIDTQTLPSTGTYTLLFDPENAYTGSGNFTLYNVPPDFTSPIQPGGPAIPVTITTPGQNGVLTFNGATGQKVSLTASNSTIPSRTISIKKPDGSILDSTNASFLDSKTLPATGAYTILIDPPKTNTGNLTVALHDAADVTGTITPGGPPVSVTLSVPGQQARITFDGTAGQKVSLKGTNNTLWECVLAIKKPDGTDLTSISGSLGITPFLDTRTLPATGTYTILVDPVNTVTGSITLDLYDVVDVTGTTMVGGSAVTVAIATPGQNGQLTFSGTAGQQVTVRMTGNTIGGQTTVKLLRPDGTTLTTMISQASSFNLATQTLATTGTYTIIVDPSGANTGSINVSVTSP